MSFSLSIFFLFMAALTAVFPVTHLAGWLAKIVLYILVLGLSFLVDNASMTRYAEAARVASIFFLIIQILIIIDLSYKASEWFTDRADAADDAAGWEPGLCSNGYRAGYTLLVIVFTVAAAAGLGLLFAYWGSCPLNNFFTSQTLVTSCLFLLASALRVAGKGLLPPAIIAAYIVYLTYSAITNNPDGTCNALIVRNSSSSKVSIITGLAIAVLSVTWVAISSAGSAYSAVSTGMHEHHHTTNPAAPPSPTSTSATTTPPAEWVGGAKAPHHHAAPSATYQEGGAVDRATATGAEAESPSSVAAASAAVADASAIGERPWLFHIVMMLAAMYLAMMSTNWGLPGGGDAPSGTPELSEASMWARMGSVFVIEILFTWTLFAPRICKDRDFS